MSLIALVGFAGSGKNSVADILTTKYNFASISFAGPLKDAIACIFSWDRELLEGVTDESRIWRETVDTWWGTKLGIENFTPRFAMQNIGTDVLRDHFNDHIWLLNCEKRYLELKEINPNIVITDTRFPNEIKFIHDNDGELIEVRRGKFPDWYGAAKIVNLGPSDNKDDKEYDWALGVMNNLGIHESEWRWIGWDTSIINNNSSLDDLENEVKRKIKC